MNDYLASYSGSHALVVGINVYPNAPGFNPLGEAERDAMDLAEVLEGEPYNFRVRTLLAEEATRTAILDALYELETADPDERILFYFAGHGYTLTDNFGYETGHLACYDTVPTRHHTALRMDEVTDFRKRCKAKHIAFIFDACFSGQALGLTRTAAVAAECFLQKRAYHAISAGGPGETVADSRSMTRLLLHALKEPALVDAHMLTIERLGAYLKSSMAAESRRTQVPQFGQLQGSGGGDLVLYLKPEKTPLERLPERLRRGLGSADADMRYFAIDRAERLLDDDICHDDVLAVLQALSTDDPDADVRKRAMQAVLSIISSRPPVSRVIDEKPSATATQPTTSSKQFSEVQAPSEISTEALADEKVEPRLSFEPEMVPIPAGAFLMGSTLIQVRQAMKSGVIAELAMRERQQHEVDLAQYSISRYPVTNAEYQAFIKERGYTRLPDHWNGTEFPQEKGDHPVVYVSWEDAQAYCRWLAQRTGKPYRLPCEAEWEKAARGTDGRLYPWGNKFDSERCNIEESGIDDTTPVGRYQGTGDSPYGVVDMAGNVWEWTSTLLKDYPYTAVDGREDLQASGARVLRGGSFDDPRYPRCAFRLDYGPRVRDDFIGFRVALSLQTPVGREKVAEQQLPTRITTKAPAIVKELSRLPFEPELVRIPAGAFLLGSSDEQLNQVKLGLVDRLIIQLKNEVPQHKIELPEYYIGKYPLTNSEYQVFIKDMGYKPPSTFWGYWDGEQYPEGKGNHPVVYITWEDAQAYCQWLEKKTGRLYRLPTEAEWEKAARGTDERIYPWGDEFDPGCCNTSESGIKDTTPVGKYQGIGDSPYGVVDMAGNAWEWTSTLVKGYPYRAHDGRENLQGTGEHVVRGGSFYFNRWYARCAFRSRFNLEGRNSIIGFRVAISS